MKKLIIAAAIVCAATISQAAAVGWSGMNAANFKDGDYSVFVIGMKGVENAAQIKAIVEAGGLSAADDYAFFSGGSVSSGGAITKAATTAPVVTITYSGSGTDTYQAFVVMQNADGNLGAYTTAASISMANDTDSKTWGFGNVGTATTFEIGADTPEPTSGLLLLVGLAGLALKRKRA